MLVTLCSVHACPRPCRLVGAANQRATLADAKGKYNGTRALEARRASGAHEGLSAQGARGPQSTNAIPAEVCRLATGSGTSLRSAGAAALSASADCCASSPSALDSLHGRTFSVTPSFITSVIQPYVTSSRLASAIAARSPPSSVYLVSRTLTRVPASSLPTVGLLRLKAIRTRGVPRISAQKGASADAIAERCRVAVSASAPAFTPTPSSCGERFSDDGASALAFSAIFAPSTTLAFA